MCKLTDSCCWQTGHCGRHTWLVVESLVCSDLSTGQAGNCSCCVPHAFLLVLSLHILHADTVEEHLNHLLEQRVWRHTMVLFTRGNWLVDMTLEQHISSEGGILQRLVENCENRDHIIDNRKRENVTRVTDCCKI